MSNQNSSLPSSSSTSSALRVFSITEIRKATNNFDESFLLKKGCICEIYKGTYEDHDRKLRTVSIKCFILSLSTLTFFERWFQQQLEACSQFHHENVVPVIGYCRQAGHYILVYENMANGSLAQNLCKKITPTSFYLSVEQCLQICIDAARGLEYMHNNIRYTDIQLHPFVFSDVSAITVLLDENGIAKICDLYSGLDNQPASLFDPQSHSENYVSHGSDVYAFGVLLIKVLSRKVSFDKEDRDHGIWLKECIQNKTIQERIIHPETKAEILPDFLTALLNIAGECLNDASIFRPKITEVIDRLEFLMSSPTRHCHLYSLQEIKVATNNFENILGKGGEGTVYKGVMRNTIVAVKHLKSELSSEFEKEIKMLSDRHHPNLVSLIGYCHDQNHNILIYEFMSNGNLAQILYGTTNPLSWMQSLNICIGAARGLSYLHKGTHTSPKGIIHRDIKPANILLDSNFNAKISDFGLSKIGPQDQENSEIFTNCKGTPGFIAPEYHRYGLITRRIDVYSFGVVLFEVLCRKKLWTCGEYTENNKYSQWAKKNIDPHLKMSIDPVCLEVFVGILEKCLSTDEDKRPRMNDVVLVLEYALKWQEAWQMHNSTGNFRLPGTEDKLVLYCPSSLASSINIRLLLQRYAMLVEERDVANELCVMELKQALGSTTDIHKPHLFFDGKHIGDADEITRRCVTGELAELLGLKRLVCSICQEARACVVCQQTESCGALTLVLREMVRKLRSCLECRANSLFWDSITFYFRRKIPVMPKKKSLTRSRNIVKEHKMWIEQETYCLSAELYLPLLKNK